MKVKQVGESKYQVTFTRDELVIFVNGLAAGSLLVRDLAAIMDQARKQDKRVAKLSAKLVEALETKGE